MIAFGQAKEKTYSHTLYHPLSLTSLRLPHGTYLVRLFLHYAPSSKIVTRSPSDSESTTISKRFIERHSRILFQMMKMGCEIGTDPSSHVKGTVTSRGELSGSFNLTASERGMNIKAGFYFPNVTGTEKKGYDQKLSWVKEIFAQATRFRKK
jgi:hypothetical protein